MTFCHLFFINCPEKKKKITHCESKRAVFFRSRPAGNRRGSKSFWPTEKSPLVRGPCFLLLNASVPFSLIGFPSRFAI